MYHIAKNLCKNELRNRERRDKHRVDNVIDIRNDSNGDSEEIDLIANTPANQAFQPEVALERKELRNAIQKAIAELPEQYRLPLVLRDLQGLSYEEIGEVLELRSGTTKSRINRARLMLKDKLKPFI
jgi:RNA polymerase sigma-70 factor (ECF subfamily)